MAYTKGQAEALEHFKNSHAPEKVKEAVEAILKSRPGRNDGTPSDVVVDQVLPGAAPSANSDMVIVSTAGGGGNLSALETAPIVVVEGNGAVQASFDTDNDRVVQLGGGSADVRISGHSNNTVAGGSGDSTVVASTGADSNNYLQGGSGNDRYVGGLGHDTLSGGAGNNKLIGGANGSTFVLDGQGNNTVTGSSAFDTVAWQGGRDNVSVSTDANGNMVLTDKTTGHVSTLGGAELVTFADGSTIVQADTIEDAIVARLYQAAFDRAPDAGGLNYWFNSVESGLLSLTNVANAFFGGTEYNGAHPGQTSAGFVNTLYQNLFGRPGDAEGVAYWTKAVETGAISRGDLAVYFASSAEGASATANDVLLRAMPRASSTSDASGAETITASSGSSYAAGGSKGDLILLGDGSATVDGGTGFDTAKFSGSLSDFVVNYSGNKMVIIDVANGTQAELKNTEFVQFDDKLLINTSSNEHGVIARMYDAVLDRTADASGAKFWWDAYDAGHASLKDIATSFLSSPEFQADHANISSAGFVTVMYQNMLSRAPDQQGLDYWTKALDSGAATKADLVVQFAAAAESQAITADKIHIITDLH